MNNEDVGDVLSGLQGNIVKRIRRILYVYEGRVASDEGPLELTFADENVLLRGGPDGERLTVERSPWVDPFREPLSPENAEFVRESGKWTAFDVSRTQPYTKLVDDRITDVIPIRGRKDKITGAVLMFAGHLVSVQVEADEMRVFFD
jgi:hypothetical protein